MPHVLVIGAAGGIGGAMVRALIKRGDSVIATVRTSEEAKRLTATLPGVTAQAVDLADADRAAVTLRAIVADQLRLDAVVFCAGSAPFAPTEHTPLAVFRQVMEVNAFSPVAAFQATVAALRASRGRFMIVSSLCGRIALPIMPAYSASKFAVEAIADAMRREVAADGVAVIVIEPGGVRTGMTEQQAATARAGRDALPREAVERYGGLYDSYEQLVIEASTNPPSTAEQVAAAMLEALDADEPEARYVVGADAVQALTAIAGMSDREADAMVGEMLSR